MTFVLLPVAVLTAFISQRCSARWWGGRVRRRLGAPDRRRVWWAGRDSSLTDRLQRRRVDIADDVAPTLDRVARSLAAGDALAVALAGLGQTTQQPFAALVMPALARHDLGEPLADALASVGGGRSQTPEVTLGLSALELAARHGGRTAASLDRVAAAARERRSVVAERRVHAAQARLSALVLTLIPIGFACWSAATDARVRAFVTGSALGVACVLAGLLLNLAGWAWMRRIIRGQT